MNRTTITSGEPLSTLIREKGIGEWQEALRYVRDLPYGRNANRGDLSLVIREEKGTCSSKHAFLRQLALENRIPGVRLILGLYRMHPGNTPGIGKALPEAGLDYLPEAHCYLELDGNREDFTSSGADIRRILADIIEEQEIHPEEVNAYKVHYHREFLGSWLEENKLGYSLDELWTIREQCITGLSG